MKKIFSAFVLASVMVCQSVFAADLSKLVIMHTNDTHGYDQRAEGINGLATVKALKDDFEKKGYNVLLVDAGDAIQDNNLVNLSKGKTAIQFFNAVGYDAATFGNHEFDYGQDILQERMKQAKYAYVCANVLVEATGKTFAPASKIITKGDVKIGVFGMTTPETLVSTNPKDVYGLQFLDHEDLIKAAQKEVDFLKTSGADVIVALAHIGSYNKTGYATSEDILANVKGIDVFVDGHDHKLKNKPQKNGSIHVSTGDYTKNIGVVTFKDGKWVADPYKYGRFNEEDQKVKKLVDKAVEKVAKAMNKKVATVGFDLDGARNPGLRTKEMAIGDLIADAYLWQGRQANVLAGKDIDCAFINGGGIRKGINKGTITYGNVCAALPYNSQLYVITIPGSVLLEVIEASTYSTPVAVAGFPQVAGVEYEVDTTVPFEAEEKYPRSLFSKPAKPGARVTIKTVNGKPFDINAEYSVVATEFQCNGGDTYAAFMPYAAKNSRSIGYIDSDALVNYLKTELGGIVPEKYKEAQGRIIIKK